MAAEKKDHKRKLIQKTLFRTVSRNLVRQLHEQGCTFRDLVDFANEVLEEIVAIGTNHASTGTEPGTVQTGPPVPDGTQDQVVAHTLETEGRINLTADAYVRKLAVSDMATIALWREEAAVSASLAGRALKKIVAEPGQVIDQPNAALFVICRETDGKVIGLFGFPHIEQETRQAQLIKMIGEPCERGKHYARLATRVLLDYGFQALDLNRIYLYTLDGNLRNISLNQSLGFSFEGLLRQAVRVDHQLRDVAVMALVKDRTSPSSTQV
jgi:RimJ/RimL family protein N-acetyltransferase